MERHSHAPFLKATNFHHHEKSRKTRSRIKSSFDLQGFENLDAQTPRTLFNVLTGATIRELMVKLKGLYNLLGDIHGVSGDVDKKNLSRIEGLIRDTLTALKAEMALINIDFNYINPNPIPRDLYWSPNYRVRAEAIRKRKQYWKKLLEEPGMAWTI